MDKFKPDFNKHCYFQDPRYPIGICYDYNHQNDGTGYCRRYKTELNIEIMVDDRPDGVGHFKGQRHKFPVKCVECEYVEGE